MSDASLFIGVSQKRPTIFAREDTRLYTGFTVLELLVVITIIVILAGLILATAGYVEKKGARSRAEAEIAAMSAAMESYKADNGIYPSCPSSTPGGHALYQAITGDGNDAIGGSTKSTGTPGSSGKNYMQLRNKMVSPDPNASPTPGPGTAFVINDPFRNSYGYSSPGTYNPTFDLWSTANANPVSDPNQWVKNW